MGGWRLRRSGSGGKLFLPISMVTEHPTNDHSSCGDRVVNAHVPNHTPGVNLLSLFVVIFFLACEVFSGEGLMNNSPLVLF